MLESRLIKAVLFALGGLALTGEAHAYTIETHFTPKCHENDDLQFAPDPDMRDLAGATLLVGVRDNDLKGNSQDDLTVFSAHGDPTNQREHCLRGPGEKEPGGSAAALADCRAFIQERVLQALGGLDAAGGGPTSRSARPSACTCRCGATSMRGCPPTTCASARRCTRSRTASRTPTGRPRTFVLVVNPLSFALPVPQLSGVPLTYPQYRMSLALEIYKG